MNKKELMYQRIRQHGENLKKVFGMDKSVDPVNLCKRLFRLENKAHKLAEDYCNGLLDGPAWDTEKDKIKNSVDKILHYKQQSIPVFFNGDPRGYALKIDDDYIRKHDIQIYRDWGGYGIIAPDFKE